MKLTIGTRGSNLAIWQANWVKAQLEPSGWQVEIKIIKTTGDKLANVSLTQSGIKGLFIKEIEEALLAGEIDLAVHSLKDLPNDQPDELFVAAVPEREDARDVLVSRDAIVFADLSEGSRVGTSSLRRQSQLASLRRDIEIVPLRGNIDTRLSKLDRGECDAVVVAAAGLLRLGLHGRIAQYFLSDQICPAVGQGALAIEIRKGDHRVEHAVSLFDHRATHQAIRAERAMLRQLGGGCQLPIAGYAAPEAGGLRLTGVVASIDGTQVIRASSSGSMDDPASLGAEVAALLQAQGATAILHSF